MKKKQWTATKYFYLIGGLFGALWVFLTPPCQAPDENEHFLRSLQISQMDFRSPVENGMVGGFFNDEVVKAIVDLKGNLPFHPELKFSHSLLAETSHLPLNQLPVHFHAFANTPSYSPVAYIGSALGLAVSRLLDFDLLTAFRVGRFFNFVFCLFISALAIEAAPAWNFFLAFITLTPIAVFQRSSFSADAMTNALSLLVFCMVLRWMFDTRWKYEGRRKWIFLLASAGLPLCKPSYVLIPMLLFLIVPREKFKNLGRELAIYCWVAGGPFLAWIAWIHGMPMKWRSQPHGQIMRIITHPFDWMMMVCASFFELGHNLFNEWVGVLGWQDTPMPRAYWLIFLMTSLLVFSLGTRQPLQLKIRGWLCGNVISGVFLIILPLFITWTLPNSPYVQGLQGRYFIPLAPIIFLGLLSGPTLTEFFDKIIHDSKFVKFESSLTALTLISSTVFLSIASAVIFQRYYGS